MYCLHCTFNKQTLFYHLTFVDFLICGLMQYNSTQIIINNYKIHTISINPALEHMLKVSSTNREVINIPCS